jgi:hypothetical protein
MNWRAPAPLELYGLTDWRFQHSAEFSLIVLRGGAQEASLLLRSAPSLEALMGAGKQQCALELARDGGAEPRVVVMGMKYQLQSVCWACIL